MALSSTVPQVTPMDSVPMVSGDVTAASGSPNTPMVVLE